jgi:hypothetical protein
VYVLPGYEKVPVSEPTKFQNATARRSVLATSQDYSIYGVVVHKDRLATYKEITKNCFLGWGFKYCTSVGSAPELSQYPYNWQDHIKMGEHFCIQCCDNKRKSRGFEETWNLKCPVGYNKDESSIETNRYEYQFRFARRSSAGDKGFIECLIPRPREVQTIRVTDPVNRVGGTFQLYMDKEHTFPISVDAVAMNWNEDPLSKTPGSMVGNSMQHMLQRPFGLLRAVDATYPDYWEGVDISRTGPDSSGGFTWSVTFPRERFNVPIMYPKLDGLLHNTTVVDVRMGNKTQLHGVHLTVTVGEESDGVDYWRSVTECSVETIEEYGDPASFYQSFTLKMNGAGRAGGSPAAWALCLCIAAAWQAGGLFR